MIEAIELTSTRRSRGAGGEGGTGGGPVEKVSFDVYPGQVTALLGAPGTGKSTVLRMMVELEPARGRTLFGGRPYRALRPAVREVGLALNPDAVHPGRTVQAHLALYSAAGGVPKPRIAEVLEVAGLSTQATIRCGRLDPGQRQRLAIAAALLGDPAALILDEPHALDTHGMTWFHALIRAYAAQGRTVLIAATDPDSLAGTADHVVVLRRDESDGISRVIASRSAAEVFDERRATVVQVRSPQAARLAAALESEGARLSPAGPGALQVRGLDRARIGEVAHLAGVCLHELCEIGHDDDVFGLRPLPRQKELIAAPAPPPAVAPTRTDAPWQSGVRLVVTEIEEAELVEAATEASAAAQNPTTVPDESAQSPVTTPEPETGSSAEPSVVGSWRTQGSVAGSRWSAVKGAQAPQGTPVAAAGPERMTFVAATPAADIPTEAPVRTATEPAVSAVADNAAEPPQPTDALSATVTLSAVAPFPTAAPARSVASSAAAPPPTAEPPSHAAPLPTAALASAAAPSAAPLPTAEPPSHAASLPTAALASAATPSVTHPEPVQLPLAPAPDAAPAKPHEPHRRASAFGRRWGRRPQPPAEPVAATTAPPTPIAIHLQPAVPFTVAAASGEGAVAGEGMTPWRAATARASQHAQEHVSVAEAAPAEKDPSA